MNEKIDRIKKEVIKEFLDASEVFGTKPTYAKLYMTLFFSLQPLGLKELSKETGYSVSTVSQAMDHIEKLTDVRKFKKPGSKKIYFECLNDICLVFEKKFRQFEKMTDHFVEVLEETEEKLSEEDTEEAQEILGRVRKRRKDYEAIREAMENLPELIETHKKEVRR